MPHVERHFCARIRLREDRISEIEIRAIPDSHAVQAAPNDSPHKGSLQPAAPSDPQGNEPLDEAVTGVHPLLFGRCQRCGEPNDSTQYFCTECGLRLRPGVVGAEPSVHKMDSAWRQRNPARHDAWAKASFSERRDWTMKVTDSTPTRAQGPGAHARSGVNSNQFKSHRTSQRAASDNPYDRRFPRRAAVNEPTGFLGFVYNGRWLCAFLALILIAIAVFGTQTTHCLSAAYGGGCGSGTEAGAAVTLIGLALVILTLVAASWAVWGPRQQSDKPPSAAKGILSELWRMYGLYNKDPYIARISMIQEAERQIKIQRQMQAQQQQVQAQQRLEDQAREDERITRLAREMAKEMFEEADRRKREAE